jgi:signal transduction histidine kinase
VRGGSETEFSTHPQGTSKTPFILFPTLEAERLAAEYLDSQPIRPADSIVQSTQLRGVLRMAAADRTIVALFKEDRLRAELIRALGEIALPDVAVTLLTSKEQASEAPLLRPIEAGDFLPGWRLALAFKNGNPFEAASKKQMRFYLWTGLVMVVVIGVLALAVARNVIAQMKLARLKDDLVSTVSHELKTPLASMRALADTLSAGRYRNAQQLHDYLGLASGSIGRRQGKFSTGSIRPIKA